jgi:hypothetical protein
MFRSLATRGLHGAMNHNADLLFPAKAELLLLLQRAAATAAAPPHAAVADDVDGEHERPLERNGGGHVNGVVQGRASAGARQTGSCTSTGRGRRCRSCVSSGGSRIDPRGDYYKHGTTKQIFFLIIVLT